MPMFFGEKYQVQIKRYIHNGYVACRSYPFGECLCVSRKDGVSITAAFFEFMPILDL